jgi:hypothetical protein
MRNSYHEDIGNVHCSECRGMENDVYDLIMFCLHCTSQPYLAISSVHTCKNNNSHPEPG